MISATIWAFCPLNLKKTTTFLAPISEFLMAHWAKLKATSDLFTTCGARTKAGILSAPYFEFLSLEFAVLINEPLQP